MWERTRVVGRILGVCMPGMMAATCALALEPFDADPGWEGRNNRPATDDGVHRQQDFGFSETAYAGGGAGEIGGRIERTFTPAYFAKPIPEQSLNDRLEASGTFSVPQANGGGVLIGWFHEDSRGWRTPNSLVFQINGESGTFRVFYEYGTRHWKTGGGQTFEGRYQDNPNSLRPADGTPHTWKLHYNPEGANGDGLLTLTLDDQVFDAPMAPGHKADGAVFNRFGIMNTQIPGGTVDVYLDNLTIGGETEHFDTDPGWNAQGNRANFRDTLIRPVHDFGYSATNFAGGQAGEIGGAVWRIESMDPQQTAFYAKPVEELTLDDELEASGKVVMTAASADSGVLIGWFNEHTASGAPPKNFLGVFVEGPSRIGHYFRPVFGSSDDIRGAVNEGPVIHADSVPRAWDLHYSPKTSRITVTLDGEPITLDVPPEARKGNAAFNRFGMLSWLRGGHFVKVYLDDLAFTGE